MKFLTSKTKFKVVLISFFVLALSHNNSKATTYYVSNTGKSNSNGTSPETAWQTIDQINSQSLEPGDSVLFEAGGIWRETLELRYSGTSGNNIVFSRYGSGVNPQILASEKAIAWTETGTSNVWQSATALDNYSDEYYSGRIFFLANDSISWGQYQTYDAGLTNLTKEHDYTVNGTTYYVYSTTDPDTRYSSVEVTQRLASIAILDGTSQSYLEFNGIDMKFGRQRGFDAGYPEQRGATDLIFRNCTIGYIGSQPSGSAYGISAWHSNFLAENNVITDCGRRGISINLYLTKTDPEEYVHLKNIIIRNNVFKRGYHTTSLDLSSQMTDTDTIENVYFYNNIVDDSDFSTICEDCGSNQIFVQNGSGVNIVNNIYVVNNVFIEATARNILYEGADTTYTWYNTIVGHNPNITLNPYANVAYNDALVADFRNNILFDNLEDNSIQNHGVLMEHIPGVFLEKDYNLYYSLFPKNDRNFSGHRPNSIQSGGMGYWNTNDWADYLSENTNFEHNSPSPQDPLFLSYSNQNYRLTEASAAKSAGTPVQIIITDVEGNVDVLGINDITGSPRDPVNPSIGAFEYQDPDSSATDIIYFVLAEQTGAAAIDTTNHTVAITVKHGAGITNLTPTITLCAGATINPLSGTPQDFTDAFNYTVTALNGVDTQIWTVTITEAPGEIDGLIDSNSDDIVEIYPNPTTGNVYVKTGAESIIRILNLSGSIVYEQKATGKKDLINCNFENGIYFIQSIDINKITYTKKLIVQ